MGTEDYLSTQISIGDLRRLERLANENNLISNILDLSHKLEAKICAVRFINITPANYPLQMAELRSDLDNLVKKYEAYGINLPSEIKSKYEWINQQLTEMELPELNKLRDKT